MSRDLKIKWCSRCPVHVVWGWGGPIKATLRCVGFDWWLPFLFIVWHSTVVNYSYCSAACGQSDFGVTFTEFIFSILSKTMRLKTIMKFVYFYQKQSFYKYLIANKPSRRWTTDRIFAFIDICVACRTLFSVSFLHVANKNKRPFYCVFSQNIVRKQQRNAARHFRHRRTTRN